MYLHLVSLITIIQATYVRAVEVGREVEGGVQVLNVGPIQLNVPEILSFTIKEAVNCKGLFRICYLSDPKASRDELKSRKYWNVGGNCPDGHCLLKLEPEHDGVFGLAQEDHEGNWYGLFLDGTDTWCPRYIVDGISNFTVIDLPTCPVIIDGAKLPKDKVIEPVKSTSNKRIIMICVGMGILLLMVAIIVGLCLYVRPKKKHHPIQSNMPD